MEYTIKDIEKITEFKSWSSQRKLDELLRIDCEQYTNLGSDSSKAEREEVKKYSRKIYRLIRTIDKKLGDEFLHYMD